MIFAVEVRNKMTKQEALIISAYTGILMVDFGDFHKYVEELLNRPVYTHEMAVKTFWDDLQERLKPQFLELCEGANDNAT
jgi:hypothetical protein